MWTHLICNGLLEWMQYMWYKKFRALTWPIDNNQRKGDNILCWNFKVVLLFLSDKTSNLCNHLGPRKTTQAHFRSYADLKLLWGPNSRVTCWVSSATRLSVTSCNAANASTLRWTLRHTPLNLKVTVSIPDIAICIAVPSMNASLSQGNNSCSLITKGKR